jgi:hypothetical protein
MKLLSPAKQNPKLKKYLGDEYLGAIMYLAPADTVPGANLCPFADSCRNACLFTAGRGGFDPKVKQARINRTLLYLQDRSTFDALLYEELVRLAKAAYRNYGKMPVARLNGTSDIAWERDGQVPYQHPDIQFYDYTKVITRLRGDLPSNYHLTFSLSSTNDRYAQEALDRGFNVAVVFRNLPEELPDKWCGVPLVNGDLHDYRFLDPNDRPHIIALKAKGPAKKDTSGFVRDLEVQRLDTGKTFVPFTLLQRTENATNA